MCLISHRYSSDFGHPSFTLIEPHMGLRKLNAISIKLTRNLHTGYRPPNGTYDLLPANYGYYGNTRILRCQTQLKKRIDSSWK
jgi:hypothetical protein